jgi:hypothetical protein
METSITLIIAVLLFISISNLQAQKQGQEKIDSLPKELSKAKLLIPSKCYIRPKSQMFCLFF